MNAKGVSPLLATVLLILVAVGIGAIVWVWTTGFVGQATSEAGQVTTEMCTKGRFEVTSCSYASQQVTLWLKNTGDIDLNSFRVVVRDSAGNVTVKDYNTVNLEERGGMGSVTVTNITSKPAKVEVYSNDCPNLSVSTDCS